MRRSTARALASRGFGRGYNGANGGASNVAGNVECRPRPSDGEQLTAFGAGSRALTTAGFDAFRALATRRARKFSTVAPALPKRMASLLDCYTRALANTFEW